MLEMGVDAMAYGSLADLREGEAARVAALENAPDVRQRLWDLGLVENTWVKCVIRSLRGDPVAYEFRGAVIALRIEDARLVLVK